MVLWTDGLTPVLKCIVQPATGQEKMIVPTVHPAAERPSEAAGTMLRSRGSYFVRVSFLFFCPAAATLQGRPAAPSLCQRRCLPRPQIKNPKGAARKKWLGRISQDLCQKCFSPQVICCSLGLGCCYFKEPRRRRRKREKKGLGRRRKERERNEREEGRYLVAGIDR